MTRRAILYLSSTRRFINSSLQRGGGQRDAAQQLGLLLNEPKRRERNKPHERFGPKAIRAITPLKRGINKHIAPAWVTYLPYNSTSISAHLHMGVSSPRLPLSTRT